MKTTKTMLFGFVTLLLVILCAGCIRGGEDQGVPTAAQQEMVTLTFMLPQTHFKPFLKEAIQRFEEEQKLCKIEVQVIPDNQWVNMVKVKAFTHETPDIIRIDKGLMLQIGAERFVELDESEPWMARVIPSEIELKRIDGKNYGLPVSSNSSIGIVYNQQLFTEYGLEVPKTMEEMWQVCERFRQEGVTPLYASDKDSWTIQTWFTSAAPQLAPEGTWDKLMTNRLWWSDVPEFGQILADMAELRARGYTNANHMMATYASAVEAMAGGQVAMYVSGHFFVNDVLAVNPEIEIGMTTMVYADKLTAIQGQGMFGIFQKSDHVELAKAFLDWFSQAENMDIFTEGWGYGPLFKDQTRQLPPWLETLNKDYFHPGKLVFHVDSQLVGVDFVDFWSCQQELVGGQLSVEEALQKWDEAYSRQMKDRKMAGWGE